MFLLQEKIYGSLMLQETKDKQLLPTIIYNFLFFLFLLSLHYHSQGYLPHQGTSHCPFKEKEEGTHGLYGTEFLIREIQQALILKPLAHNWELVPCILVCPSIQFPFASFHCHGITY